MKGPLGLPVNTRLGRSVHFFICDAVKILILISLMLFCISYVHGYFQPQKTREIFERIHDPKAHPAASRLQQHRSAKTSDGSRTWPLMAVTTRSVPERITLRTVMKPRLIAVIVTAESVRFLTVVWMFNPLF